MRSTYNTLMFICTFLFASLFHMEPPRHISVEAVPSTIEVHPNLPNLDLVYSAETSSVAVRLTSQYEDVMVLPSTTVAPTGIFGLPFAPEGLSDCDEFDFYRQQFGLPERFNKLAWRESNCRNEDGVRTWCCYGYLQLYVSLQIQDYRITERYNDCGVYSSDDVNSDEPLDKQRQVCAAKVLFDVVGYSAWSL